MTNLALIVKTKNHLKRRLLNPTWSCKSFLYRPPQFKSRGERSSRYSHLFGPLIKIEGFLKESYTCVVSFVVRLFVPSGPPAISWGVVPIVFNSIKAFVGGLFSHVLEEVRETTPPLTDFNSPSPIIFKVSYSFVIAPPLHLLPAFIGRGSGHSMSGVLVGDKLRSKTATGPSYSLLKITPIDPLLSTTATKTYPISRVVCALSNRFESPKRKSSQITSSHTRSLYHNWGGLSSRYFG